MQDVIEEMLAKGARIIAQRGENPQLIVTAEEHFLRTLASPESLFTGLKPVYFFCEGIESGRTLNYAKAQELDASDDITSFQEGEISIETFYQRAKYDLGMGYVASAMIDWYSKSPSTTFVGIDLIGGEKVNNQIMKDLSKIVADIKCSVEDALIDDQSKMSTEQYKALQEIDNDLYLFLRTNVAPSCYHLYDQVEGLSKEIPDKYLKANGYALRIRENKKQIDEYNADREVSMGVTMVDCTSQVEGICMGTVGGLHLEEDSKIIPIIHASSLDYLIIDLGSKKQ